MKRVLVVFLCALLLVTMVLSGCKGKTTDEDENHATEDDVEGGLAWQKDTSPISFTCYIDYDWYALDTWGEDDVSKEITRRTGVSLEVSKASDRNQLQILLATDELPEIVFTDNMVQRFQNPDVSYSFDELIEEYCPEFMDVIDPIEIINNTVEDGHFYTLKSHYNNEKNWADPRNLPSPGDAGFYVREDIMKEMGNPKLDSIEDVLTILEMVKEEYPDMITYIPHPGWTNPFMEWMGLTKGAYVADDGTVKFGIHNEGFIDYYKFYNKLFREGYVSQESFTYKPEQFFQIVRSGDVFSASYNSALASETNKIFDDNGIEGKFVPITKALTYNGEIKFKPVDAAIGWSSTFITKKNKNPDRAIKYMQFLKSAEGDELTQWGIEDKHYTLTEDGLLKRPEGFNELTIQETGIGPWYFMASGLGEGVAVTSSKVNNPKYSSGVDLLTYRKAYYERNPALYFTSPQADTDEFIILAKINDLVTNSEVAIITSASEQEALDKYNKMLKDAEKIGLSKLEQYMTEEYNKAKIRYDAINK